MSARSGPALMGVLMVYAGACSDATGPGSDAFCASHPDDAVVEFEDPSFSFALQVALYVSAPQALTCGRLESLTNLNAASAGIVSIEGIENLSSLTVLSIRGNAITDVSPLRSLAGLTSLNVAANQIRDVEPLRGLTGLTFLAINDNGSIDDIGPLSALTNLTGTLWIGGNSIADLEPLRGLVGLTALRAWDNEITDLGPLAGLSGLTEVSAHYNALTSTHGLATLSALRAASLHHNVGLLGIQELIDNPALGGGAEVNLAGTAVSCADVDALSAKGVGVISDCP